MSLIKDIYNRAFYTSFAKHAQVAYPAFPADSFVKQVLGNGFKQMEWKERLLHTTHCFRAALPKAYPKALKVSLAIIQQLQKNNIQHKLEYMFFPQLIAEYGMDDFDLSLESFEKVTQFISCEFAVRPFILQNPTAVIKFMKGLVKHPNEHVRRFASEGLRPRLPWGLAIPAFKADPSPLFPILKSLMQDESLYVRKSVANHLNDISKDHPQAVLDFVQSFNKRSAETDWIIKHALRTLLKAGHPDVMRFYGLEADAFVLTSISLQPKKVPMGGEMHFSAGIENTAAVKKYLRLEYAIYFKRQGEKASRKVFKISERDLLPGEKIAFQKKHSFKPITTRVYYPGDHRLSIIVNGKEVESVSFVLH